MSERVDVLDIDLSDVREEADKTGKTLKELRAEVKDLRSQLEDTEIGTDKFTSTLDELTKKQQELTNVTKTGVAAQKNSYNDLVNQMAILKKEWRATADEAERAALGEQIGEINSKLKELDATLGNHQRNVGNYEEALSGVNIQIGEQNDLFGSSMDTVRGLMGSYQLIEGSIKAFGVDSEEATKAIQKMQGVMAMTEGLKAIKEGVAGFKQLRTATKASSTAMNGFKKALIGTGIGALVVAVGTLIANWEEFTGWLDKSGVSMEKFGQVASGVVNVVSEMFGNLGKAMVQLFKGNLEDAGTYFKEAFAVSKNYSEGVAKEVEKQTQKVEATRQEAYEKELERQIKLKQHHINMLEIEKGEEYKYSEEMKAMYQSLFDMKLSLYKKDTDEYLQALEERAKYEKEYNEQNKAFEAPKYESLISEDDKKAWEAKQHDTIANIKKLNTLINKEQDKQNKREENAEENKWDNRIAITSAGINLIDGLMSQNVESQKGFQVAQTLMNTATAAMQAAADWSNFTLAGKIAAIATILGMGMTQVANIKSVSVGGGGSASSNIVNPSISALSMMQSGVQSTTLIDGESTVTEASDTKVYVLESDITKKQNDVKTTVAEATF